MSGAEYVASYLAERGLTHVFEVVGGMTTHMIDALHRDGRVRIVSVHHEQAAAFAVDAYGRMTGEPGVALATSGPGATNLLTGIGSCYFDSVPAVFITGQVNRHEQKGDRPVRQLGFQETDIVSMARPITKGAWMVQSGGDLPGALERAFALAREGRPGPVLIDIPMDVQREHVPDPAKRSSSNVEPATQMPKCTIPATFWADLATASQPLILVGGGVIAAQALRDFRRAVDVLEVPVVNSLMAVDALAWDHPMRCGFIGSYGNRWANHAIAEADLLLVVGSRLDIRQTGADTAAFKGSKVIYHVDIDPGEVNNRIEGCHFVHADVKVFLRRLMAEASGRGSFARSGWNQRLHDLRAEWPSEAEYRGDPDAINPQHFLRQLSLAGAHAAVYVSDVGQHQMWCAQSLRLRDDQRFLNSGGMGAMGYGLPAAIGAAFLANGEPVVLIAGDGGFQLNLQELQTVVRNQLPIKIIILNNQCHGMVRQFQESYFGGRYPSTMWGYSAPDFAAVAHAYGIAAGSVADPDSIDKALHRMFEVADAPYLLQVMIDPTANVYPKIAFGHPLTEMEPFATPIQMEST